MEPQQVFGLILTLVSALWVLVDATRLGVRRGVIGGKYFGDLGIATWVFIVFMVWIVGFPAYLVTRPKYVELRRSFPTGPLPSPEAREAASHQLLAASRQMEAASRQVVGVVPAHELPLAGWFPDTSGSTPPGTMRWWDGNAWTVDLKLQPSQPLPYT